MSGVTLKVIVEADANDIGIGVAAHRRDGRNRRRRRRRADEQIFELRAPAAPEGHLGSGAGGPGPEGRRAGEVADRGLGAAPGAVAVNRAGGCVQQDAIYGIADAAANGAEPRRLRRAGDGRTGACVQRAACSGALEISLGAEHDRTRLPVVAELRAAEKTVTADGEWVRAERGGERARTVGPAPA